MRYAHVQVSIVKRNWRKFRSEQQGQYWEYVDAFREWYLKETWAWKNLNFGDTHVHLNMRAGLEH